MKIRPVVAELIPAGGRTDRITKLIVVSRNVAKKTKNQISETAPDDNPTVNRNVSHKKKVIVYLLRFSRKNHPINLIKSRQ
jgi:hypothetical protein